jgi:uncharacterized protein YndB with AHSA1/START domain
VTGETHAEVRRRLAATPDKVFAAFAEPGLVARWLTPSPEIALTLLQFDFRVGGRYRFAYHLPEGGTVIVGGAYRCIEPPSRIVFSWVIQPPDEHAGIDSEVTITITPDQGGSALHIRHEKLTRNGAAARHAEGWGGALDRLAMLLETPARRGKIAMIRFGLGVLAYLVPTFALGFAWHLILFEQYYKALAIYRVDIIIPFGLVSMLLQATIFAWIYQNTFARQNGTLVSRALRYAACGAALSWSFTTLAVAAKNVMASVPDYLVIETAFTVTQWIMVGPLTALAFWQISDDKIGAPRPVEPQGVSS